MRVDEYGIEVLLDTVEDRAKLKRIIVKHIEEEGLNIKTITSFSRMSNTKEK